MKKILKVMGIIFLMCFSFFYTNKIIDISKSKDPIMKEILKAKESLEIKPVNAEIIDNDIIPGVKGSLIDVNRSYEKMKKLGNFNDRLLVYKDSEPDINLKNNYDKYIVRGNSYNKEIALIFALRDSNNLDLVLKILKTNNIRATFFIDGEWSSNYSQDFNKILKDNHYIANLGIKESYDLASFNKTKVFIENQIDYKTKYCLNDGVQINLSVCAEEKMYTIKPEIINNIRPYKDMKNKLTNGAIFLLSNNDYTLNELDMIIKYVKQRGYNLVDINELISDV